MKKMASYKLGFWTKIPKIPNLKSIFKPIRNFSRLTPNIKNVILGTKKNFSRPKINYRFIASSLKQSKNILSIVIKFWTSLPPQLM